VLATDGSTLALDRGRAPAPAFDGAALASAAAAAERYILAAQEPDGPLRLQPRFPSPACAR
jgi:hypothetical protein